MDKLRKKLKVYYREWDGIMNEWKQSGYQYPPPITPVLPDELRDLRCGAKTKSTGRQRKRRDLYRNGRCKLHGGLSTGPKTEAGKRRVALNGSKAKSMRG